MFDLKAALQKAQTSSWELRKFNFFINRGIPFMLPHGIRVQEVSATKVLAQVPYKRKNLNHLKGIHACCLATVSELVSGLALMNHLSSKEYRLIMRTLKMEYHYQAKSKIIAEGNIPKSEIEDKILSPLLKEGVVFYEGKVLTHDDKGNHVSTATVEWQIKEWKQVKTKV